MHLTFTLIHLGKGYVQLEERWKDLYPWLVETCAGNAAEREGSARSAVEDGHCDSGRMGALAGCGVDGLHCLGYGSR